MNVHEAGQIRKETIMNIYRQFSKICHNVESYYIDIMSGTVLYLRRILSISTKFFCSLLYSHFLNKWLPLQRHSLLFYFNMYHGHESQMAPYMTVQIARHKPSKGRRRSPGRPHKRAGFTPRRKEACGLK
jgi:hypothetical protein